VPQDQAKRQAALEALAQTPGAMETLSQLDAEYHALDEDLDALLEAYVRAHPGRVRAATGL
jgi:hypothetical protein